MDAEPYRQALDTAGHGHKNAAADGDARRFAPAETVCFVLGNGPSLRGVSLPDLPGATLGMNAAYRYWNEIGWRPTYYACLDLVVGLSHQDAIAEMIEEARIRRFLLRQNLIDALGDIGRSPAVLSFEAERAREPLLSGRHITTGSHAALWAASIGHQPLILLGIDGRYKEIVEGARRREGAALELVEEKENPNYFFDGYQRPGDLYNIPNAVPDLHLGAWAQAAHKLEEAGVTVINANPSSEVGYFPAAPLGALLEGKAEPAAPRDEIPKTPDPVTPDAPASRREKLLAAFRASRALVALAAAGGLGLPILTALLGQSLALISISAALAGFAATGILALAYVRWAAIGALEELDRVCGGAGRQ